ncbi:MAG: MFS transporter [Alphaproteobacteria bacterium]
MTSSHATVSTDELSHTSRIKAIVAGSAGNLIEWYGFFVYALTALYFSGSFFPKSSEMIQLIATSAIFAVGFFFRPVGGWYFGRFADRNGRQAAMVVSVLLMGLGSLMIAVLPTYAQIGVFAPILLLLSRIIQGFSTGGQYGTAATYLSEIAGKNRRGFYSSFQYVTLICGQLLATALIILLSHILSPDAMKSYGWRIAFLVGAIGAGTILLFRHAMHETSTAATRSKNAGKIGELKKHIPACLTVAGLTAGGSLSFYTFTTYMQKYLVGTTHLSKDTANNIMLGALTIFMCLQPIVGSLADKVGRRNILMTFAILGTLFTLPILAAIAHANSPLVAFGLVMAGLVINTFYTAVSGLFKAELFPMHVRALGVGLSYGIANAIFGGTAENVALGFKAANHEHYFYWYVTVICAISVVTAIFMRDTRKFNPLDVPTE